jgi:hypothetical protein
MNTDEIEEICNSDSAISRLFLGVFPCDRLPEPKFPSCLIANTEPASSKGEHWVSLTFDYDGTATYFCSFGGYPNETFQKFLQDYNWFRTSRRIQSLDTDVCAHYCIAHLHFHCRGVPLKKFMSLFTVCDNDDIVRNFVRFYYRL